VAAGFGLKEALACLTTPLILNFLDHFNRAVIGI